tara:strand:+ start:211 stop:852 length:642 start_codon:yes stop_codon:yes gene_type:complete
VILFLDTVSSLPEFSIIEDNKIIHSNQILSNQNEKMSDLLIPSYLSIEKKYNLKSKLQLLLINTGPGSYTALRVGIAFFSGLSLSQNIDIIGLPCIDLFRFIIPSEELMFTGVYISSSNDQNFIYFFDLKVNQFKIKKIEKNKSLDEQDIDLSILKNIYINESLQGNLNLRLDIKVKIIKFSKLVNQNIKKIEKYKKNEIIEPLYFSNNKILN